MFLDACGSALPHHRCFLTGHQVVLLIVGQCLLIMVKDDMPAVSAIMHNG